MCVVPTYDEAENIEKLIEALLELHPSYEILVVDDDSPDRTWEIVERVLKRESRVNLLHRKENRGRGSAGRDGFVHALAMGADIVIELDADFSHQPRFIPIMIKRLTRIEDKVGLVLGSRGVAGGSDSDRTFFRRGLTIIVNAFIQFVLDMKVRDCNSGFRCWSAETLKTIKVEDTFSTGPAIVQELLFKTHRANIKIAEIPIEFVDRSRGQSTLNSGILLKGYLTIFKLLWLALRGKI